MKNKCKINEENIPESNFKLEKPKWYSRVKSDSTEAETPNNIKNNDSMIKEEDLNLVIEDFTKDKLEIVNKNTNNYNN